MIILSLLLANNTAQAFSGVKDSSLSRLVIEMFKWIFLCLIFTPHCKYNYNKNNVKFLQLTSSELLQKILKLYMIVCCFKLLFYFRIIFYCELNQKSTAIFDNVSCKFSMQVLYSLNLSRSLHFLQLEFVIMLLVSRDNCSALQNPICQLLKTTFSSTCK